MTRPRILVLAKDVPWPRTNGYRHRLASQVEGLTAVGDVQLVSLSRDHRATTADRPESIPLLEYHLLPYPSRDSSPIRMIRWLISRQPRRLLGGEWVDAASRILELIDPNPDLVWWSHTDAWVALKDRIGGVSVLDFDNIESARISHRRSVRPADDGTSFLRKGFRRSLSGAFDAVDERRWKELERRAAAEMSATVVCSEVDLDRTADRSARIIPNGYEPPFERTAVRPIDSAEPKLLFVGLLTYEPNAEGLMWFVAEILPHLRVRHPGLEVRVVGRLDDTLADRLAVPNVELRHEVPDLEPELRWADVALVPLQIGGGTRLKIIEAFATGIPVVSTSVGAEGLAVENGRHLLIADEPRAFAAACSEIISDERIRAGLVQRSHRLFDKHYRWSAVCSQAAELARDTLNTPNRRVSP